MGLVWYFDTALRRQRKRGKEEKKRARQASFLDTQTRRIADLSQPERERLKHIFEAYHSPGREYSFLLKDGRSFQGVFSPIIDDYIQFATTAAPIYFESVSLSIPMTAVDLDTLAYLDFDADEPQWQKFRVAS